MGVGAECLLNELLRRHILQRTVRSHPVVVLSPQLHPLLGIRDRQEPVLVQAFLPEASIECLHHLIVALRRAGLTQHPTGATLRHQLRSQHLANVLHCRAAKGRATFRRAQEFPDAASFSIEMSSAWSATSFLSWAFSFSNSLRRLA